MTTAAQQERLAKIGRWCWIGGSAGLAILVIGAYFNAGQFFRSWLFAFVFWLSLALGCLVLLMLQYIVHGAWGYIIRRTLEAGIFTLPLLAMLFIPVLFGMQHLYPWVTEPAGTEHPIYHFRQFYMVVLFFIVRAAAFLSIWMLLMLFLLTWSRRLDKAQEPVAGSRLTAISTLGMIIYFPIFTLAATDWIMSLEPKWFSTIFGAQLIMGQTVAAISLAIMVTIWLRREGVLGQVVQVSHINDLGNLLLAFIMLWTYMAFMQYLIIWSGNLREDNLWFLRRSRGGWPLVAAALALIHFAIPFAILLSRTAKRNAALMFSLALCVFLARVVDCFWLIVPGFQDGRGRLSWMDPLALIGIGGLWCAFFLYRLRSVPPFQLHDSRFVYLRENAEEVQPS